MSSDPTLASMARLLRPKTLRIDRETGVFSWLAFMFTAGGGLFAVAGVVGDKEP